MSEINAIRFAEPWQVSCVKIPMPEPKPGEALIKIMQPVSAAATSARSAAPMVW